MPRAKQPQRGRINDITKRGTGSNAAMSKLTSTGSPEARSAGRASEGDEETRDQLYARAAALGINGRSRMTKAQLATAVREHQA